MTQLAELLLAKIIILGQASTKQLWSINIVNKSTQTETKIFETR